MGSGMTARLLWQQVITTYLPSTHDFQKDEGFIQQIQETGEQ